jgi:hypothetical protein
VTKTSDRANEDQPDRDRITTGPEALRRRMDAMRPFLPVRRRPVEDDDDVARADLDWDPFES